MRQSLVSLVWKRAKRRCEYCRLPQEHSAIPFEIDHVIARKHGGPTHSDNLALACFFCNSAKGPNIAGIDPQTGKLTALFHPRRQRWSRHFHWDGPWLLGWTRIGRTTIAVLEPNETAFVALREVLMAAGIFPSR